jgi:hypothetical protein
MYVPNSTLRRAVKLQGRVGELFGSSVSTEPKKD